MAKLSGNRLFTVSIIGPDGSGKSAVAVGLAERLAGEKQIAGIERRHLRPALLPPLSKLVGFKAAGSKGDESPHGEPPFGALLSLFRLSYYSCDYILGAATDGAAAVTTGAFDYKGSGVRLIIYERYFYDFLVEPHRVRIGKTYGADKFIARFIPRPDMTFYLEVPPEKAYERKGVLSIPELTRQTEAYRRLVDQLKGGRVIDAKKPLEQVVDRIAEQILEKVIPKS